jgi:hypothetical protein
MKPNGVYVVLAFVIGLAFGLSFSLTVRPAPEIDQEKYHECISALTLCDRSLQRLNIPTATPHVCPPPPEPCPTVLYKELPDVTGVLSTLGLVDYEMALVDTKLENFITSTEGEFDWNLIGILALHRSAHNYLLEAGGEITYWYSLGELTCPDPPPSELTFSHKWGICTLSMFCDRCLDEHERRNDSLLTCWEENKMDEHVEIFGR